MAEQATVLGRVVLWKGVNSIRAMTVVAEFFSCFFLHEHETLMFLIMRQFSCCFSGRVPEKEKNAYAEQNEEEIVHQYFFLTVHFIFHTLPLVLLFNSVSLILQNTIFLAHILINSDISGQ